jgi:hypothetical protein
MKRTIAVGAALAMVIVGHAASGSAEHALDGLHGIYFHQGGEACNIQIEKAVEEVVSEMGRMSRGIARHKLLDKNHTYETFQILIDGGTLTIQINHRDYEVQLGAPPVEATGIEGGTVMTQATVRGRTLVQTFRTSQGLRRHEIHFGSDGTAFLEVSIESQRLPKPVHYSLPYARH